MQAKERLGEETVLRYSPMAAVNRWIHQDLVVQAEAEKSFQINRSAKFSQESGAFVAPVPQLTIQPSRMSLKFMNTCDTQTVGWVNREICWLVGVWGPKDGSNRAGSANYTVKHTRVKVKQDSKPRNRSKNANRHWKKHRQSPKNISKSSINTKGGKKKPNRR